MSMMSRYSTIITRQFKTANKSIFFFLNCSLLKFLLHHILGKMKFDSLVHLILKYLLGYVMIDHIVLTITRKVNFLSFRSPRRMIVWKVAAFGIGLDLYDEVLASSGVF